MTSTGITEAPSEIEYNYENSGTSENSDESQPVKRRTRGRPKGTITGKYTINPNQKRGTKLGKKYVFEPKIRTPEQIEASLIKRRKSELDHYYRVRDAILDARKLVAVRKSMISQIVEYRSEQLREQLSHKTDSDLNELFESLKELVKQTQSVEHAEEPVKLESATIIH